MFFFQKEKKTIKNLLKKSGKFQGYTLPLIILTFFNKDYSPDLGQERGCVFSRDTFLLFKETGKPGVPNK